MELSKREQSRIERRLIASLTEACETAKAQIPGFAWLTHDIDYQYFPKNLHVIWIFATQAEQDRAIAEGQERLMLELTAIALRVAGIQLDPLAAHVHVDNEQACQRKDAGNWQQRLARQRATRP